MKKYCVLILALGLSGCFLYSDDDGEILPTVIEGTILYEDTLEPVLFPRLVISAMQRTRGTENNTLQERTLYLTEDDGGKFSVYFEDNKEIDYFDLFIVDYDDDSYTDLSGESSSYTKRNLVCQPTGCNEFKPGREYIGIKILVPPRP